MKHNSWKPERQYHNTTKNHFFDIHHRIFFFSVYSMYVSPTPNLKVVKVLLEIIKHLYIFMWTFLLSQLHPSQSRLVYGWPNCICWFDGEAEWGRVMREDPTAKPPGLKPLYIHTPWGHGYITSFHVLICKMGMMTSLLSHRAGKRIKCDPFTERT